MVLAICTIVLFTTNICAASEKTLHAFGAGLDGAAPNASLVWDADGNLYGTTSNGGSHNRGTVFELSPDGSGGWTEKVLHNFGSGLDGATPVSSLVWDADGNLYGTTVAGGTHCPSAGCGTVFELTPNGNGGWTEKVLHNFGSDNDGGGPDAGLVWDNAGNLYGTTQYGGTYCPSGGCGTVFEMTPNGSGEWTEKVLHYFGNGMDGQYPRAGLVFDAAGNLYGTTTKGGVYSVGTVFEMTPNGDGGWTEKVLHNFGSGMDGQRPLAGLIFDAAGNLYGATSEGGSHDFSGTVFEMTPDGSGGWREKILHNFGSGKDGAGPESDLIFDGNGNLYGITVGGGSVSLGTAFEMTPNGSGGWTEFVLHNFGVGTDGYYPWKALVFDNAGNLCGTAPEGSTYGQGMVFEITPD
jgi:uncharacterized repeat protein (TIGR03803 family)